MSSSLREVYLNTCQYNTERAWIKPQNCFRFCTLYMKPLRTYQALSLIIEYTGLDSSGLSLHKLDLYLVELTDLRTLCMAFSSMNRS